MKQFDAIRAFYVQRRSVPKPPYPHYEWDYARGRFKWISAGWHSEPRGYTDPEKQEVFVSILKFKNGKPVGKFGRVMLDVDRI